MPFNELSDAVMAKLRANAVPSRELAGCLWVFTGLASDSDPVLPESLQGEPTGFGTYYQDWQAHWSRAVENFIDFTHPPYAHRDTIGAYSLGFAERGGIATVDVEAQAHGMTMTNYMGDRRFGFRADWYAPNMTRLHFGPSSIPACLLDPDRFGADTCLDGSASAGRYRPRRMVPAVRRRRSCHP